MKNVVVRSLSGIVYIALIVGALLGGGWWFLALCVLFAILAGIEYQSLTAHRGTAIPAPAKALDMAATLALLASAPLADYLGVSALVPAALVAPLYLLSRMSLALAQKDGDAFASTAASVLGVAYIGVPLAMLSAYVMTGGFAPKLVLGMFVLIWLNDTGAFCAGSLLGKHKLCERLSPKKSWEGFWGGMLACIIAAIVTALVDDYNMTVCVVFAVIVSIFSTWGDLFESLLKRSAHVKDAGHLIPGHGGILDRIDSLLFVAIATVAFAAIAQF